MIPNSKINTFERLFSSCVFEHRYLDQASDEAFGGTWNGDAAITTVTGQRFNRALTLDGTGDYIDYGNNQVANFGTGDFSVEMVIKSSSTSEQIIAYKRTTGAGGLGFSIRLTATNGFISSEIDDDTGGTGWNGTTNMNDGVWRHVIVTVDRDGNGVNYVNGSAEGNTDVSGAANTISNTAILAVGSTSAGGAYFNGQIALVRIWNKSLTASEVAQLAGGEGFGSGTPIFGYEKRGLVSYWPLGNIQNTTVNDIIGTNHGSATSMDESNLADGYNQYRSSLDFDGSADIIKVSSPSFIDDTQGTVSAWIRSDQAGTENQVWGVNVDGATDDEFFITFRPDSSDEIQINLLVNGGTSMALDTDNNILTDKLWHHCVVLSDGSTIKMYLDGVEVNLNVLQGANSGQWLGSATQADVFTIGAISRAAISKQWNGGIQDVMVYDRALTVLEIDLLYNRQRRGLKI
ncbi:hypothetical protein CL633_04570 [bacterium]|nr:hypothetical protein [bacterium]|tara:strand:+ start:9453 stop:10835 length:1383 start_codon:yes stop_codon:yes gene_type:complete